MNALFRILLVCTISLLLSSCSNKDHGFDKTLIKGTWKGTASYKQISEVKTYSPVLEDSLTKLIDSFIIIQDIVLDISKEEIRFYGFKNTPFTFYNYHWDKDRLAFQKGIPATTDVHSTSFSIRAYASPPSGNILKLEDDSLVLQLAIYKDGWDDYLLKLKRR